MTVHKIADPVPGIPCFGVYADYDANAPDTATHILVATEELAKEVCAFLNKDARAWNQAFVDGCESCKSWQYRPEMVAQGPHLSLVRVSLDHAISQDDFFEDCEGTWGKGWRERYEAGEEMSDEG